MKRLILICFACLIFLCGCSDISKTDDLNNIQENTSMFIVVEENYSFDIVYHKKTYVMYSISHGAYNQGNFTLLVNADGTPMIYSDNN